MWRSDSVPAVSRKNGGSVIQLAKSKTPLLQRAISFQFLNKSEDSPVDRETRAFVRLRYKDVAKHVIWPSCRIDGPIVRSLPPKAPLEPTDPRAVLFKADMEDERTPYLAATINDVLRSDSEDSSDGEEVVHMTRL